MTSLESTFHLALKEIHAAAGASVAKRHGWLLPVHYGDMEREYHALREQAAVADRSHRSRIMVTGTDAAELLGAAFAGHPGELEEGRARRAVWLDGEGRIGDLVLIARTGGIAYLVAGEPARRFETVAQLQGARGADWDVRIDDRTESTCLLSLAGPRAAEVVERFLSDALPARLPTMMAAAFEFHGFRALAMRASATGDDGFEFMLAPAVAQHLIETLAQAGIVLAGDDALEVARVEACIPAFEPDLEPRLTPAQADLDVLLEVDGGDQSAILAGVILDGDPVRTGTAISIDGRPVGQVRSCVRSPGLNATIGLALLDAANALPGTPLDASGIAGTIVAKPFYRRRT
ncbi:MAG: glycine cleavage T C-terminal barrel domain-containing protein [Dehalococcoidia bacterium]